MTTDSAREEYQVEGLPEPISHYTDAVRWGDLLFVSGCAAIGPGGTVLAPGDVAGQAKIVHEYLGAALRAAGTDFSNVVKVVVYLTNVADRVAVNEVRRQYFGSARPASTLIEVKGLVLDGLLVEVAAVAGIPG